MRSLKYLDKNIDPPALVEYTVPDYGDVVICVENGVECRCTQVDEFWHGLWFELTQTDADMNVSISVEGKAFIDGVFIVKPRAALQIN